MKKLFLLLFFALTAMVQGTWAVDSDKLHVKMEVPEVGDSIAVLCGDQELFFAGKNGRFEFDITLQEVTRIIFVEPRALRGDMEDIHIYRAPAVPGETLHLWAQPGESRYDIDGTGFYASYHHVDLASEEAAKELVASAKRFNEMREAGASADDLQKYIENTYQPLVSAYEAWNMNYIKAHPTEEASVMLLSNLADLAQVNEALQALSPEVREGRMKSIIGSVIAQKEREAQKAEEEAKAAVKQAPGTVASDFTLTDIDGRPLRLSTFRGKYVILDFWGSWCIWCIKGFPKMKEYYEKYKGKFEIIGIACNDEEAKWKAAVNQHKLPWKHVICPDDSPVLIDYAIQGFPTKIIVDQEGKIVKTIVGEDPSFYTLLDELFGK